VIGDVQMSSKPVLGKAKAGVTVLKSMVSRPLNGIRINATQRRLELLKTPGRALLDLTVKAEHSCRQIKNDWVLGDYFIKNNPWSARRWQKFNYWNGWYALAAQVKPSKIIEIGTAFGFSTISLARGARTDLNLLVSLDLGNFGRLFSTDRAPVFDNLAFVKKGLELYKQENHMDFTYLQFAVNTQPPPYSDNEDHLVACPYWKDDKELKSLFDRMSFDLILIDGKHTEDGLYNDLQSFFPCLKSGGLMICDDIQHPDAAASLRRFIQGNKAVSDFYVWRFLHSDSEYEGTLRRDQGLILKK
jgi:hypothetical protein